MLAKPVIGEVREDINSEKTEEKSCKNADDFSWSGCFGYNWVVVTVFTSNQELLDFYCIS